MNSRNSSTSSSLAPRRPRLTICPASSSTASSAKIGVPVRTAKRDGVGRAARHPVRRRCRRRARSRRRRCASRSSVMTTALRARRRARRGRCGAGRGSSAAASRRPRGRTRSPAASAVPMKIGRTRRRRPPPAGARSGRWPAPRPGLRAAPSRPPRPPYPRAAEPSSHSGAGIEVCNEHVGIGSHLVERRCSDMSRLR